MWWRGFLRLPLQNPFLLRLLSLFLGPLLRTLLLLLLPFALQVLGLGLGLSLQLARAFLGLGGSLGLLVGRLWERGLRLGRWGGEGRFDKWP